jgi:hypothetical protein
MAASVSPPPAMLKAGDWQWPAQWSWCRSRRRRTRTRPPGRSRRWCRPFELRGQPCGGLGADVQDQVVVGHVGGGLDGGGRVGGKGLGGDHVGRDRHLGAARLHGGDHGLGLVHQIGFGQALADGQARRPA